MVWSIDGNDQSELTRATLPSGYSWSDQFGQTAETGSARADILATTRVNTSSQGLDQPASDTVTPELGEDTTSWPSDLGGDPIEVPFVGTEYWIPGDTAPTEQAAAPTDAVVVSSVTLTATSLEPLVGPANSPHETTDGYFVWQWATPQSDYVDAWTEGFGEPGQVIRVSAPTMATSATPTVALTDRSLDTAVISGPTMGVAADLYWDAYRQTPGAPPTCGPGNRVFDSSLDPVAVTAAGSYTPPSPPTFSESGTYLWVATLASADDGTVIDQGGCGDPTEQTEVKTFGLTTLALSVAESGSGIYDVATVEGPTPVGAVLQFSAYRQSSGMPACGHEDVAYTSSLMPITGAGNYRSPSSRLPAGRYDWVATAYDRNGDVLQAGACGDHGEVSTVLSDLAFTGSQLTTASTWITAGSMALGGLMVGATLLVKRRRSRSGIRQ